MPCACGSPDCPAKKQDATVGDVVIHVLAAAATVSGDSTAPGYVPGFGGLSAEAVQQLAASAKLRPVVHPKGSAPEPRYQPSAALADFIRCRDLTCRFPGCDRPAEHADIDHTVPWPLGPTHPSNLKLLCRIHHLIKTFWGWSDEQLPDGTEILATYPPLMRASSQVGQALTVLLQQSILVLFRLQLLKTPGTPPDRESRTTR